MSEIFAVLKNAVTARQAADRYGLVVNRTGMARCPFHDDASPSMKLDERYYCFGCGATGDAVDLTAKILGLTPIEAALHLASDFGIPVRKGKAWSHPKTRPRVKKDTVQDTADWARQAIRSITNYLGKLHEWKEQYAPKSMEDENWHSLFQEAFHHIFLCYIIHASFNLFSGLSFVLFNISCSFFLSEHLFFIYQYIKLVDLRISPVDRIRQHSTIH